MSDFSHSGSARRVSRRTLLIASGSALVTGVLAACAVPSAPASMPEGSASGDAGPLTFTYGQHANFTIADKLLTQEWQKATAISIEWQAQPSPSLTEKIQLMLSSGDATDIFLGPRSIIQQLGPESCLALDDLIKEQMPNYGAVIEQYGADLASTRSPDSKLYGIWGRNDNVYLGWMYRKDLADKLGFSTLDTLEDWYNFMKAAKADDPNTNGVGIYGDALGVAWAIRGAYGIHGQFGWQDWTTLRDGKLLDASIFPEAQEAINTVRTWYTEGLMDPDLIGFVENQPQKEKWMAGKSVVAINDYLELLQYTTEYRLNNPDATFEVATTIPAQGPSGERANTGNFTGWAYAGYGIGANCKDPAAASRFIDYLYSDEGLTLYWLGREGVTFEKIGDSYQFLAKVMEEIEQTFTSGTEGVDSRMRALQYLYGMGYPFFGTRGYPAPGKMRDAYTAGDPSVESKEYVAGQVIQAPYMDTLIPVPTYNEDEADELATLRADIDTYRKESFTNMISGATGMDQWDAYVAQMKQLGVERVEEIINTAYQRTGGA